MIANWTAKYVGLPWLEKGRDVAGVDCWGLLRLVYADVLGIELPSYDEAYASVTERDEVAALTGQAKNAPWIPVTKGEEVQFDMLVFRRGRWGSHVGLVVNQGLMLHISEGLSSFVQSYDSGQWRHRLTGIYRHCEMERRRNAQ
jgi:probable lipoprotein NlpC